MKFSEHLTAHVTPEWHKQYITYEVSGFSNATAYITQVMGDQQTTRIHYFVKQDCLLI